MFFFLYYDRVEKKKKHIFPLFSLQIQQQGCSVSLICHFTGLKLTFIFDSDIFTDKFENLFSTNKRK